MRASACAKGICAALLLLMMAACTRDQIAMGVLGGAKNWCRHSGGNCHVDGKPAR